jgi:hypothetical protein
VDNKVSIVVAAGVVRGDAFYARTVMKQTEILECSNFVFPGNHIAFTYTGGICSVEKGLYRNWKRKFHNRRVGAGMK